MRAAAPVLALFLAASGSAAAECREDRVTIQGGFGTAHFAVQVADEPEEQRRGLMYVEHLGTLEGMLFVYPDARMRSFWMANTLIPLDMVFAGPDGTILAIHPEAVPLDRTSITSPQEVQFALEISGGLAERLGIAVGDLMQHPAIGDGAALPCG